MPWILSDMRNPFFSSAAPKFVDRDEILGIARASARRIAAEYPSVSKIVLFGSFARGDYGWRSDLDLLVILETSEKPPSERIGEILSFVSAYPTDVFPYTIAEIQSRLSEGDPFLSRALSEGIILYPE